MTSQLPFSIECEQAILGSLIFDNRKIDAAAADLERDDFYDPMHRRIFAAIIAMHGDGTVTPLRLWATMQGDPGLSEVGGHAYIVGLAQSAPAIVDIAGLTKTLREFALRRALVDIADELSERACASPPAPAQGLADAATEALLSLGTAARAAPLSPFEAAMASLRDCEDMAAGKPVPLVRTGLAQLDEELGGLRGGDLVVVAARSGQGKSAFMGCVSLNTARAHVPTIVFSLEMTARQWVERMVCDIDFGGVYGGPEKPLWYSRVRNGRMNADEFSRFGTAAQELHGLPLEIHDDDYLTIQQITARARAFKAKHGGQMGLVVLDYLQITNPGEGSDRNREQAVASIARGAKSLAKRLGWAVVAGSQMNEGSEQRTKEERKPQAGDVRESKAIMNEADLILSPYRLAYYVENRKPLGEAAGDAAWASWKAEMDACRHRMDLLCLKNRHGRRFEIELYCDMGASAIRDSAPVRTAADAAARELALS